MLFLLELAKDLKLQFMISLQQLKKRLEKIETELSKCRGSVMDDGWQTQRYAKKMRKWDYYAQKKMKLIQLINDIENQITD
jgi:hypothetical protein